MYVILIVFIDENASLPAHDFVREQHPAHFWILVLTLVYDGLKNDKKLNKYTRIMIYNKIWSAASLLALRRG